MRTLIFLSLIFLTLSCTETEPDEALGNPCLEGKWACEELIIMEDGDTLFYYDEGSMIHYDKGKQINSSPGTIIWHFKSDRLRISEFYDDWEFPVIFYHDVLDYTLRNTTFTNRVVVTTQPFIDWARAVIISHLDEETLILNLYMEDTFQQFTFRREGGCDGPALDMLSENPPVDLARGWKLDSFQRSNYRFEELLTTLEGDTLFEQWPEPSNEEWFIRKKKSYYSQTLRIFSDGRFELDEKKDSDNNSIKGVWYWDRNFIIESDRTSFFHKAPAWNVVSYSDSLLYLNSEDEGGSFWEYWYIPQE